MADDLASANSIAELQAKMATAGMLANNPHLAAQMAALSTAQARAIPTPPPAATPQGALTQEQIAVLLDEAFKRNLPNVHRISQMFEAVFVKALPADDYAAFQQYVAAGSPGLTDMMASGKFDPLAQLTWETIKENAK
jgi:hypothetical protein